MKGSNVAVEERAGRWSVRREDVVIVAVGVLVVVLGMIVVRDGEVPGWEEAVFHAVNDLPGFLYPVLWPFQQMGVLVVGPILAVAASCCAVNTGWPSPCCSPPS